MKTELMIDIKEPCETNNVIFFFKQWGGRNKKKNGRELMKQTWDDMPEMPEQFATA